METALLIVMGILGIIFYNLAKAKEYIADNTFSLAIFIKDNIMKWIWSTLVILVVATTLLLEPKANEVIKLFTGLDLENTKAGWLLFGAGLCGFIRNAKK